MSGVEKGRSESLASNLLRLESALAHLVVAIVTVIREKIMAMRELGDFTATLSRIQSS